MIYVKLALVKLLGQRTHLRTAPWLLAWIFVQQTQKNIYEFATGATGNTGATGGTGQLSASDSETKSTTAVTQRPCDGPVGKNSVCLLHASCNMSDISLLSMEKTIVSLLLFEFRRI